MCFHCPGTEQTLLTLASLRANLPDPPDPVDEHLINTKVKFLPEESCNVGSLDMRKSDVGATSCSGGLLDVRQSDVGAISCNVGSLDVRQSDVAATPCLKSCRGGRFQIAWTKTSGTNVESDMCYTPDGLLAVAMYSVVLYNGNGQVVKRSRSVGVNLKNASGIAYYPPQRALAVMDHGSGDIVLLDSRNLTMQRRIRLNTDGKGHRVAVLGEEFVTVWHNNKDGGNVWISVHDKDGRTLQEWRSHSSYNDWHYVTTHKGHIYVTDKHRMLFIYNANGDLLEEVSVGDYTRGVVCLAKEILVAVSGCLVSISHRDNSVKDVLTWVLKEMDKFGWMMTVAVYKNYVAIGGNKVICVYKVQLPY